MKKEFVIITISFILLAGVLILLDLPLFNKVSFTKGEIEKYKNLVIEKKEVLTKVNQLKEVFSNRENSIKKVSYIIPKEKDSAGLIVQFEALASGSGLTLKKIDFGRTTKSQADSALKNLDLNLNLNGNYLDFKKFLEALELNVRMMDIQTISFSAEREKEGKMLFDFNVKLKVYYQ